MLRSAFGILVSVSLLAIALSWAYGLPYIYIASAVAAIVVVGHLVTLDDDYLGGWSNPYDEKKIWHRSLLELALKATVLLLLLVVAFVFPEASKLGNEQVINIFR